MHTIHMKKYAILILVSALLLGTMTVASAATYSVSPGDDIQAIIDGAGTGDTIVFGPGTYSLSATLTVDKSLTLTSADPQAATKPLLDGGGILGVIILVAADDVTIDGLEVAQGTADLILQSGSYSGTTVRNCTIHDSSGDECVQLKACSNCLIECSLAYNCAGDGLNIADGSSHSTIRNNEVHHSNSPDAVIYVYYSAAMTVECNYLHDNTASNGIKVYKMGDWGTSVVRNNLIVNNAFAGRKYPQDGNAIQLYVPFDEDNEDAELYVLHNTVDGNTGSVSLSVTAGHGIYWGQKYVDGAPVYMLDNILSNNGGWGIKTELLGSVNPGGVIDYNDFWNNTLGAISNAFPAVTVGPNNISADPLYEAGHKLGAGSLCLGSASDAEDMGVLFGECGCAPPSPRAVKQGVLDDLSALPDSGDRQTDHTLAKAIEHLARSLDDELWVDDGHLASKGQKVFEEEKKAVHELMKIDEPPAGIPEAIAALLGADQALAQTAIDEAAGGSPQRLARADEEMAAAQAAADRGDFDKAIEHYKHAWQHAQGAL